MRTSLNVPSYYYRDYQNDFPKENEYTSQAVRVGLVALPFLALYRPIGLALTCGLGALRSVTSFYSHEAPWALFHSACAVASVVGAIFLHPIGIAIATLHDMGLSSKRVYEAACRGECLETAMQVMVVASQCFYLMVMVYGSLELQVASLALVVLVEGAMSLDEYRKGRYLEAAAHMAMGAIRANQLQTKIAQMIRKWEVQASNFYVGALGEKWQFPSDHLPVGIEVNGTKVISWNVLNNAYMDWVIEKDSQGLNGSMISQLNVPVGEKGLTKRDEWVIQMVQSMMDPKTGVIALQECGQPFVSALEGKLPDDWKMIRSGPGVFEDQEILLYNSRQMSVTHAETVADGYPCNLGRLIQNVLFNYGGKPFRVINSHLPGDPNLPGKQEFAQFVKNHAQEDGVTVALGDMNFERHEMAEAFEDEGLWNYKLHTPWNTNIDPYTKNSKGIDHMLVLGEADSRNLKAEEIAGKEFALQETIDLLGTAG